MHTLREILDNIEQHVGLFSTYVVSSDSTTPKSGEKLPLELKPAAQLLNAMGCNITQHLSMPPSGGLVIPAVVQIRSFDQNKPGELSISQQRLKRFQQSGKVYFNPEIISGEEYKAFVDSIQNTTQTAAKSHDGIYFQNRAVGLCHSQEIELLIEQQLRRCLVKQTAV